MPVITPEMVRVAVALGTHSGPLEGGCSISFQDLAGLDQERLDRACFTIGLPGLAQKQYRRALILHDEGTAVICGI